jgi:cytochrome oxidase Cu insertion factor (SCO1/SenC/PrrC family)
MGKVLSAIAGAIWPGGAGHSENDDLTHTYGSFFDLTANDADGNPVDFSAFKGKVLLVVNSARK